MVDFLEKISKEGIVLEAENGKLKIHLLKDSIDNDLLNEIKSKKEELLKILETHSGSYQPIPVAAAQVNYPLSNAQKSCQIFQPFLYQVQFSIK